MARLSLYFLPLGIRRLAKPIFSELKLFIRTWLNILLSHRLYREHDAPFFLAECLRVLKPGVWIRITVPDASVFMKYYTEQLDTVTAEKIRQSHNRFHVTAMDVVNSAFRWKHQHLYMYDEETLRMLLRDVGFVNIQRAGNSAGARLRSLSAWISRSAVTRPSTWKRRSSFPRIGKHRFKSIRGLRKHITFRRISRGR